MIAHSKYIKIYNPYMYIFCYIIYIIYKLHDMIWYHIQNTLKYIILGCIYSGILWIFCNLHKMILLVNVVYYIFIIILSIYGAVLYIKNVLYIIYLNSLYVYSAVLYM